MKPFFETGLKDDDPIIFAPMCSHAFPPHMHAGVEVVYLTKGACTLSIGSERIDLEQGQLAVVFPMTVHAYDCVPEGTEGFMMLFKPGAICEYRAAFLESRPIGTLVDVESDALLRSVLDGIFDLAQETDLAVKRGYLHLFLALLMKRLTLKPLEHEREENLVMRLVNYMTAHFLEPITLESVSRDLGVSRYYLSHVFSEQMRVNFRRYINTLRTEQALYLMDTQPKLSVAELALDCGYEDERTFRRAFTEILGVSPSRYRGE